MRISEIKDEINKLTLEDKLSLIEDVWDSIARNNSELPMHEWQKKELDQRYSDYKAGKQKLYDILHSVFDNRQDPDRKP